MDKFWIKKELYFENYEFLNILGISGFLFEFLFLLKSQKRGLLIAGAEVATRTSTQADVARETIAWMRRGTKATWQGRGWPTRGAGGAQGVDTWQEATRVHACPRGRSCGAPHGERGWRVKGPRVSGPW